MPPSLVLEHSSLLTDASFQILIYRKKHIKILDVAYFFLLADATGEISSPLMEFEGR